MVVDEYTYRRDPKFGSTSLELQPLYHKGRESPRLDANVGDGGRSVDIRRTIGTFFCVDLYQEWRWTKWFRLNRLTNRDRQC